MRVLIVEDEFTSQKILERFLRDSGDCDIVGDGHEAVNAFMVAWSEQRPYELICMDFMMPNMDGHTALKEIRKIEKSMALKENELVKILMITALEDDMKQIEELYHDGASDCIAKPVNRQKLIKKVQDLGLIK